MTTSATVIFSTGTIRFESTKRHLAQRFVIKKSNLPPSQWHLNAGPAIDLVGL